MSRAALDAARAQVSTELAAGRSPRKILHGLASQDPVALVEVVIGPKAPASPLLVSAALDVLPALESAIAPKALYQRLVKLSPETSGEVLRQASLRHPLAAWVVRLSVVVEGDLAGRTHLVATASHPAFARVCQLYAQAGHCQGLLAVAGQLGRPEIAGELAAQGNRDAAALAVVRTLEADPDSPVLAWAVAGYGPQVDELFAACVRQLRDAPTAAALRPWVAGVVGAERLLRAVSSALPSTRQI